MLLQKIIDVESENIDIYSRKVEEIYNRNNNTPLALQKAYYEFENKNFENAAEILRSLIENFPEYTAAYFLLIKTYTRLNLFKDALSTLKIAHSLLKCNLTYDYYMSEINLFMKQEEATINKKVNFDPALLHSFLEKEEPKKEFDFVAEHENDSKGYEAASETLAKIYEAQGNFEEAIKMYRVLALRDNFKKEEFNKKADELTKKLNIN